MSAPIWHRERTVYLNNTLSLALITCVWKVAGLLFHHSPPFVLLSTHLLLPLSPIPLSFPPPPRSPLFSSSTSFPLNFLFLYKMDCEIRCTPECTVVMFMLILEGLLCYHSFPELSACPFPQIHSEIHATCLQNRCGFTDHSTNQSIDHNHLCGICVCDPSQDGLNTVIRSFSPRFFFLGLPGFTMLVGDFITAAARVLSNDSSEVRRSTHSQYDKSYVVIATTELYQLANVNIKMQYLM